jgi:His-Xaa-Ser repeat protein HxsA
VKSRRYLIPSLLLAGFNAGAASADPMGNSEVLSTDNLNDHGVAPAVKMFRKDEAILLAGHRSHSSHSSHASHRSGSSGGGYYPAPDYTPPPPPPASSGPVATQGFLGTPSLGSAAADNFTAVVRRVQSGLTAYGYYDGPIDGVVGSGMRESLRRMQSDYGLKVTGTITPEVLSAFSIRF